MFRLQLPVGDETFISHSFITSTLVAVPYIVKLPLHSTLYAFPQSLTLWVYLVFIRRPNSRSAYGTFSAKGLLLVPCPATSGRQTVLQNRVLSSTVSFYSTGNNVSVQRSKCLLDQHSQRCNDRPHHKSVNTLLNPNMKLMYQQISKSRRWTEIWCKRGRNSFNV